VINAKPVVQVPTVLGVKLVMLVNIVQVVCLLPLVKIVPWVSVKVMLDKPLVQNAAPGNSMMFLVLLLVNSVATILITVTKEEIQRVSIAQRVGHLRSAVQNAKPVVRERMVQGVNFV
jgi:hypothetical protein